jgi:hypothetical protein
MNKLYRLGVILFVVSLALAVTPPTASTQGLCEYDDPVCFVCGDFGEVITASPIKADGFSCRVQTPDLPRQTPPVVIGMYSDFGYDCIAILNTQTNTALFRCKLATP